MDVFLSHPHHPDHAFWASGQLPMIGPSAQPNQVLYPILTLPENRPRLTREQWQLLEHHFSQDKKPTTVVKRGIAQSMNVPLEKINNWFQNRRAKARQEQKKAEAAARDGRPVPESLNAHITVGEQQTLQLRPASQPIGPAHHASSLTPPQQPVADISSSHGQSTLPSPSEELACGMPSSISTSLPGDTSFGHTSFVAPLANSAVSGLPMTVLSTESLHNTSVYPSPEPTVFSSPEQQFQVTSQPVSASASQSPEGLHPTIVHDFSDAAGAENIISSGPGFQHNAYLPSDPLVPDITFPNAHTDSVLTSALTFADCPPFIDGFSLPSTPTFSDGQLAELYNRISTQTATPVISAPCEIASQNSSYLELPCSNDMISTGNVSLSAAPERQSPEQVMPPPDSMKLFKPRQSSQPSLASRRRKNAPGAIVVNPVGSMGRSGSYTAGMSHPLSPRSPLLTAPDQTLRRIKSSNNTAGRIQKPMTPAQRSPLVFAFAQNSHLLDNQTPPPSASVVETPTICHATYPTLQSMFAPEINYNVPWSAPPTQHEFMFPPDLSAFPGPGIMHSTPSPTSQAQHLTS